MRQLSRRRTLQAVGAVASTTALAGCATGVFDGGTDPPSFASRIVTDDWLQAADAPTGSGLYHVEYVDLASLAEHVDRFPVLREWVASAPLLDPTVVRDFVVTHRGRRYTVARLRDGGDALERADSVWETFEPIDGGDYRSRVRGDEVVQVVGDGVLLSTVPPRAGVSVGDRRGELERRATELLSARPSSFAAETTVAERFARVAAPTGEPTVAVLSDSSPYVSEAVAEAEAFAVGDRTTDLRAVALYPSSPDPEAFLRACRDRAAFRTYEGLESGRRGDAAVVTGTTPTKRLDFLASGWPKPQATFRFTYDGATRSLRVVHDGGASFPAARVRLVAEGRGEETRLDAQFVDEHRTVSAGDAVTATVPAEASVVEVRWQFDEVDWSRWTVLDTYVL